MFPVSDIFMPVPWYAKQSPVSFPIPHSFLFAEGAAWIPPAKVLHLCRNKCTCSSTRSVLAQASPILETVILHKLRLEGWLVVCPRDSKHYLLGTLHTALFEPPFGSVRDRRGAWVILSNMVYLLQQFDGKPLFSSMSLNSLHWNTVFSCDCDSCFFPVW